MSETTGYGDQIRAVLLAMGIVLVAFILGSLLVGLVGATLGAIGFPVFSRPLRVMFLSVVLLQGLTFGGVAVGYITLKDRTWSFIPVQFPSRRDVAWVVGGLATLLAALVVTSKIMQSFGIEAATNEVVSLGQQNPALFLLLVPLSILLVGPGEELLFRGLIQGMLSEEFHSARAIVLASALFGIVHIFSLSGEGKLIYVGLVFVLALILGTAYERTENLLVPSLIHGGYNAVQFGAAYVAATGGL